MNKSIKSSTVGISIVFVLLVYFLFPNKNLSSDSYGYAIGIRSGDDLFSPHHLLYNWLYYYLSLPIRWLFPNLDVLKLCTIFNALATGGILLTTAFILRKLKVANAQRVLWLLFIGFSFGIWRFSLENESYLIGGLFSLLGSNCFLNYLRRPAKSSLAYAGLFASFGILMHQIQLFWWLGLFVACLLFLKKKQSVLYFLLPTLILPIAYVLVFLHTQGQTLSAGNMLAYLLHDYIHGNASVRLALRDQILFIGVACVRTFLQVYPYILILLKNNIVYFLPLAATVLYAIFSLKIIVGKRSTMFKKIPLRSVMVKGFVWAHIWIAVLQAGFAFYSSGNAEFMIMTPVLMALVIAPKLRVNNQWFAATVATMFIWNMMYGAYPMFNYKLIDQSEKVAYLQAHPEARFISLTNLIQNQNEYLGGRNEQLYTDDQLTLERVQSWVDSGYTVLTDMPDDYKIISRGTFSEKHLNEAAWQQFKLQPVHTTETLYGPLNLYSVERKD
jgi:hypothetical protein